MNEILSKSEDKTKKIAEKIAEKTKGGDILALRGDLGSGKTTFVKYFAKALGIKEEITSPTFVIMKSYVFLKDGQKLKFIHIDCYRFNQPDAAGLIGLEEIIDERNAIVVIEWPEKIWPTIKHRAQLIDFEYVDVKSRKIRGENVALP